jgi:hypothetical protein
MGIVAALALAGSFRPAAATSLATRVPFDAFGLDAGGQPRVKVYRSGRQEVASFLAFDPAFTGGVRVAVGDIDGDGIDDVVAGAGAGGGPHVQVFQGICTGVFTPATGGCTGTFSVNPIPVASFFAFDPAFTGGVYVAVGNFDISNDPAEMALDCKRHEIVVAAGEGGGPHVKIFRNETVGGADCPGGGAVAINPASPIFDSFVFLPAFTGGVRVAAGDVTGDVFADLIVGTGPGGGPHVQAFRNLSVGPAFGGLDIATPVASFFAFDPAFTGGVYVALVGDSPVLRHIMVGAGAGGGPHVVVFANTGLGFDLTGPAFSFFVFDAGFSGGVRVAPFSFGQRFLFAPGPGGGGFAKAMAPSEDDQSPVEIASGYVPFDASSFGVFPSQ